MSRLKKYNILPVYIVEDHNEVLPYIYRSIGSRHLPLEGITLIHFDSHPDMLIPADLQADDVYSKHTVFEALSIENWILPAVCAGHVSHVVWLKPPWCHQIQDTSLEFYVGKCSKTGKIRTTCTESYFISETLYVPESQLESKKLLKFTIVTVQPPHWSESLSPDTVVPSVVENGESGQCYLSHSVDSSNSQTNTPESQNESCVNCKENDQELSEKVKNSCPDDSNNAESNIQTKDKLESLQSREPHSKRLKLADETVPIVPCDGQDKQKDNSRKAESVICTPCPRPLPISSTREQTTVINNGTAEKSSGLTVAMDTDPLVAPANMQWLSDLVKDGHCIVDIDLDFFSTKNPFKEIYGLELYHILQELYTFTRPTDLSEQSLHSCVLARDKQLQELKTVFTQLADSPDSVIDHPRKDLIKRLVAGLKATSVAIDYDLLHEAGCTCDDTELPHHVSTDSQISQLVDSVQEILSHLYKPTIVTVARSSLDDYCPADQVDSIQERVLTMLQEIYLEMAVTRDYETPEQDCAS